MTGETFTTLAAFVAMFAAGFNAGILWCIWMRK
jgi:hypothetical protein